MSNSEARRTETQREGEPDDFHLLEIIFNR